MAVTAEQHQELEHTELLNWNLLEVELGPVLAVPEMAVDSPIRQRAGRFIADVLESQSPIAEVCEVQSPIESLHEAIQLAAQGDEDGRKIVTINARTDVIERTIKTGHIMDPVPLIVTDAGKIIQHNQTLDTVQANSLRFASNDPIMRARTEAETRNAFRTERLHKEGFFEDYSMLVISRAEDLPEAGFFTETMTCSLQLTTKADSGLEIESAFVSGITQAGEDRTDIETTEALGKIWGVDLANKTGAQTIDTPILIHNSLIPNGVVDIVELWDDCAMMVLDDPGEEVFFGEKRPREDYVEFREKCREREAMFQPKVQKISDELIGEAPSIKNPVQATKRLHKISEKHMVEFAITDASIDARVFGPAAPHIEMARHHADMGNTEMAQYEMTRAKQTAVSSSCPSSMLSSSFENGEALGRFAGSDQYGSLQFKCPRGHTNTRPRNRLISHCQKCGVSVKC